MLQELVTWPEGATIQGKKGERFVVEKLLATGGFSRVYLVCDRRARNRHYVLKEIHDPDAYERRQLAFEGEILKHLEHPSLPHIYQVFGNTRLNRVYILMDYIQGPDLEILREQQPEKRFSLDLTLALMIPLIEAVSYLHQQQPPIVHRDIKPANIIVPIRTGRPKLVDFGLAKEYIEEKTTNIFRYGTPGYAAAEQYGQGTNPRTDIYALGATIYTLLSGVVPIDALTRNLEQQNEDPLLPLYMLNQAIPLPVSDVIEKAMSLRSEDRYATVEEFWQAMGSASIDQMHTEPIASDPQPHSLATEEIVKLTKYKLARQSDKFNGSLNSGRRYFTPYTRKKLLRCALYVLLACIILGVAINGLLFRTDAGPVARGANQAAQKNTIAGPACVAEDLIPEAGNAAGDFPSLASCYAGTVGIWGISNSKTNLLLFHIRQSQGTISGDCNGFGTTGTFSGSVTKQSTASFTMKLQNQERLLDFEGTIGSAGELIISYHDLDQNGHKMKDEYGDGRLQAFTILDLTPTPSSPPE